MVDPAHALGHRLVAVAARDRSRAEAFATDRGIERVHDGYADVIADPEVDLVYNALVNSAHTEWNLAALRAGKNVLSEKPLTANAVQAHAVREAAAASAGLIVEGFHYLHHPVNRRLHELVTSGGLGDIQRVEVELSIPAPPDSDPRWSLELGGGATMDLGCYVLHALRQLGRWTGGAPELTAVSLVQREGVPGIDEGMQVELRYPNGSRGQGTWRMAARSRRMRWTVVGSAATAVVPAFAVPHDDPRILITRNGETTEEAAGEQTSYVYQLQALAATLSGGRAFPLDVADAVANAELIDECYRRAGLTPRGLVG